MTAVLLALLAVYFAVLTFLAAESGWAQIRSGRRLPGCLSLLSAMILAALAITALRVLL